MLESIEYQYWILANFGIYSLWSSQNVLSLFIQSCSVFLFRLIWNLKKQDSGQFKKKQDIFRDGRQTTIANEGHFIANFTQAGFMSSAI